MGHNAVIRGVSNLLILKTPNMTRSYLLPKVKYKKRLKNVYCEIGM